MTNESLFGRYTEVEIQDWLMLTSITSDIYFDIDYASKKQQSNEISLFNLNSSQLLSLQSAVKAKRAIKLSSGYKTVGVSNVFGPVFFGFLAKLRTKREGADQEVILTCTSGANVLRKTAFFQDKSFTDKYLHEIVTEVVTDAGLGIGYIYPKSPKIAGTYTIPKGVTVGSFLDSLSTTFTKSFAWNEEYGMIFWYPEKTALKMGLKISYSSGLLSFEPFEDTTEKSEYDFRMKALLIPFIRTNTFVEVSEDDKNWYPYLVNSVRFVSNESDHTVECKLTSPASSSKFGAVSNNTIFDEDLTFSDVDSSTMPEFKASVMVE